MAEKFRDRLQGLLSGESTLGNLGLGLLANSGPVPDGTRSTGQTFANAVQFANQRNQAFQQTQAIQQQLEERQRRQQAMQQVQGLLGNTEALSTPQGQAQFQGLLATAQPEAFTNAMIQSQFAQQSPRAEPSQVRIARILNDPSTPDGVKEDIRAQLEKPGSSMDQILVGLQLQQAQHDLERDKRELEREDRAEANRVSMFRANAQTSVSRLRKIGKIAEQLRDRGTLMAPGVPFNEWIRSGSAGVDAILDATGADLGQRERAETRSLFDQFKKETNGLIQATGSMVQNGTATNSRMDGIRRANVTLETSPDAILELIPTLAQEIGNSLLGEGVEASEILGLQELIQGGGQLQFGVGDSIKVDDYTVTRVE